MTVTHEYLEVGNIVDLFPYEEGDHPNLRAHIVSPPENLHITNGDPNMLAQDIVDLARTTGQAVRALCGHVWVPKHNPDKCDACEPCMKIAGIIMKEMGE